MHKTARSSGRMEGSGILWRVGAHNDLRKTAGYARVAFEVESVLE